MFSRKRHEQLLEQLEEQRELLTRLDAAVVVRDPGNARSAEAFEGLRKAVVAANKDRQARVAQLVVLADMLEHGATVEAMKARLGEFLRESSIVRWKEPSPREFFEIVEGTGDELEVTAPAWVELHGDGQPSLIKPGTGVLRGGDASEPAADEPQPETTERTAGSPDPVLVDEPVQAATNRSTSESVVEESK